MASFATLSPCASVQLKASFSASSSPVIRSSSSSRPLCCPFLYNSVSAAAIQYRKSTIAIKPISHITKINCAINDSSSSRAPKETILLPGCDYEHWLIVMEFPKDPKPSSEEMIDTYIKTLAKVVGSEEEAKKKIYALSTTTYTGFQANISEELSEKCKGLPGVLWVLPDSYIDVPNKDYGGDKFVDGKVIPRPQPTPSERQTRSRYNRTNRTRYERRRDGPPRSSPVQVQQRNNPGSEQTELAQSEVKLRISSQQLEFDCTKMLDLQVAVSWLLVITIADALFFGHQVKLTSLGLFLMICRAIKMITQVHTKKRSYESSNCYDDHRGAEEKREL